MHNKLEEIKKNESPPKVIKNLFSKDEINKFLKLTNNYRQQYITKNKMS